MFTKMANIVTMCQTSARCHCAHVSMLMIALALFQHPKTASVAVNSGLVFSYLCHCLCSSVYHVALFHAPGLLYIAGH